ncbi:MAG: TFIIB-type zinc ribbon-containing protein, partial [Planctomycetota bacterium]
MDHDHEQSDPTESIIDEVEESDHLDFPCGTCGAQLTWDPDADALTCEHCGGRVVVPRAEGTILERPLSEASDAVRGFGIENRVLRCDTCGAQVTLGESSTADACVYCGSAQVLAQEANRNAIRPESLVPLDIGRDVVEVRLRRWVRNLWFRPNELKKMKRFNAIGVYVPFWTFDCQVYSEWSADAGYYYYVTERYTTTVNGKRVQRTRRKRKIRWVPAWGDRNDA